MATGRLYTQKIDREIVVILICIVNVAGFMVIFIGLKGFVVVNLIYFFIFRVLIDALHLPWLVKLMQRGLIKVAKLANWVKINWITCYAYVIKR